MLHNHYATPFMFLVTGIPADFCKWLVTKGAHEVDSHLNMLFIENGTLIPHDYIMTLTNYNPTPRFSESARTNGSADR